MAFNCIASFVSVTLRQTSFNHTKMVTNNTLYLFFSKAYMKPAKLIISNKEYEAVERFINTEVAKENLIWIQEHTQQKEEIVVASNKFGDVYALGNEVMMVDEDGKDVQCEIVSFDRVGGTTMAGLYTGNEIVRMDINDLH